MKKWNEGSGLDLSVDLDVQVLTEEEKKAAVAAVRSYKLEDEELMLEMLGLEDVA